MIKKISQIISGIKGEPFTLDKNIPVSYLFWFLGSKIRNLIYGFLVFGRSTICFVNPTSKIKCKSRIKFQKNLSIDRCCYIDALSIEGIKFGYNVSIGKNTTIECSGSLKNLGKGLIIGNNVGLGTHGFFGCSGGIDIGDDTIFGNFISLHSENHNYDNPNQSIRLQGVTRKGITIGRNCWIGTKSTILDNAIIEDGCIIAAGSLVKAGIYKSNNIYGGIPAKFIKSRY